MNTLLMMITFTKVISHYLQALLSFLQNGNEYSLFEWWMAFIVRFMCFLQNSFVPEQTKIVQNQPFLLEEKFWNVSNWIWHVWDCTWFSWDCIWLVLDWILHALNLVLQMFYPVLHALNLVLQVFYPVLHVLNAVLHGFYLVLHVLNLVLQVFYLVLHVLNAVLHGFYGMLHEMRGDFKFCVFTETTFHSLFPLFFLCELSGKAADSYCCWYEINSFILLFCLKAGGLRTYNATTVNLLRKISCGFFSILAALKPDFPKVAYVSTGGEANISCRKFFKFLCVWPSLLSFCGLGFLLLGVCSSWIGLVIFIFHVVPLFY